MVGGEKRRGALLVGKASVAGMLLAFALFAFPLLAEEKLPKELENVGVRPKLGATIDLTTSFIDENGQEVTLQKYFDGRQPVLLMLAYYECPMLCGLMINQAKDVLNKFDWQMGQQYRVVTISIDPKETFDLAAGKKKSVLATFDADKRDFVAQGWSFLVGSAESTKKIGDQLGFYYNYIAEKDEYAHGSALFVMSPDGKLSRALTGLSYTNRDLKLSLLDASEGKTGTLIENLFSLCFQFNEEASRYTLFATRLLKIAAVITLVILGFFYLVIFKNRRIMSQK